MKEKLVGVLLVALAVAPGLFFQVPGQGLGEAHAGLVGQANKYKQHIG